MTSRLARTAGILLGALALPAFAQLTCDDIEYADAVTDEFPQIAEACREVVSREGSDYVKVRADVVSVRRNVRNPSDVQRVTLRVLDADDDPLEDFSFRPDRDFRYTIDGEEMTADTMGRGQELRLYIPSDRWEMVWDLATAVPFEERIFVEDVEAMASVITLQTDEAFAFDSDALSETGKEQLDQMLSEVGDYVPLVDIVGFTDRIGTDEYNMELSKRRAEAARAYLVAQGVPENRVRAIGRGNAEPIVACEGMSGDALKECLAPNRRAEVRFMVPLVAEGGLVEVTRRYRRPDGEIVEVTEYEDVVGISSASSLFGTILDGCSAEIADYCSDLEAGDGRLLGCLYQHTASLSDACMDSLEETAVTLARREQQLNLIGSACAADLADHCASVPVVDKLQCLREADLRADCAAAVAQFQGLN